MSGAAVGGCAGAAGTGVLVAAGWAAWVAGVLVGVGVGSERLRPQPTRIRSAIINVATRIHPLNRIEKSLGRESTRVRWVIWGEKRLGDFGVTVQVM